MNLNHPLLGGFDNILDKRLVLSCIAVPFVHFKIKSNDKITYTRYSILSQMLFRGISIQGMMWNDILNIDAKYVISF